MPSPGASASADVIVVTTSYPEHAGDAQGHFVAAEVKQLCATSRVAVLAPGHGRPSLFGESVVGLGGGAAFGFPGALERLRRAPHTALSAMSFVARAAVWLRRRPPPRRLLAHFLLPCGVPIAARAIESTWRTELEVVVHGSDARLFARLPAGQSWIGAELCRTGARLRFVSTELQELVLGSLPAGQSAILRARSRVEPCAFDVSAAPTRAQARARLNLDRDGKIAVIVARLVRGKRVDVALAACQRLPNLQTIVVGDGPERARLARRFPATRFVGHVDRPLALAYVAAADALVSASLNEGAPSVVREARALGTPVVCLEAGDLRKWAESDPGIHVVG